METVEKMCICLYFEPCGPSKSCVFFQLSISMQPSQRPGPLSLSTRLYAPLSPPLLASVFTHSSLKSAFVPALQTEQFEHLDSDCTVAPPIAQVLILLSISAPLSLRSTYRCLFCDPDGILCAPALGTFFGASVERALDAALGAADREALLIRADLGAGDLVALEPFCDLCTRAAPP